MAKKSTAKKATPTVRPIREKLTKAAIVTMIAEQHELSRKAVNEIMASLETVMQGAVKGAGEFTWPGLFKVTLRKVPARKAGTMIRNPATGQMMPAPAKAASVRVRLRALSKLKTSAQAA